jgi:hypothetical protein
MSFASTALYAWATAQLSPITIPRNVSLILSWNNGPSGPGLVKLHQCDKLIDGWDCHSLNGREDWVTVRNRLIFDPTVGRWIEVGPPNVQTHALTGVAGSDISDADLRGVAFTLVRARASPFILQWHGARVPGWGDNIDMTLTWP